MASNCWSHENISFCTQTEEIKTVQEAIQCKYSNTNHLSNLSFSRKTRWLKIQAPNPKNEKYFSISIEPFLLEKITIYYKTDNQWQEITTGASQNINTEIAATAGYRILVPTTNGDINTYYLAITAPSLSLTSIKIQSWSEYLATSNQNIGFGIQLGLLISILTFALVNYALNRSSVIKRFSLFSVDLLLCLLFGSGLAMQTLLPESPVLNGFIFHTLLCLRIALWIWVMQGLIAQYKAPKWHPLSCYLFYGLSSVEILIYPKFGTTLLTSLVGTLYFIAPLVQIYAVNKTSDIPKPFKKILIWGFSLTSSLFLLTILSLLIQTDISSKIPLYVARLTDFTGPLVLLGIITYRNRLVHKELQEVKTALNAATLKADYERKLLEDRQTLIDMFAHELKNPLTSISLAVDNLADSTGQISISDSKRIANINRSIKDMDEIIERCNLMNSLDNKSVVLEKNHILLNRFIHDILDDLEVEKLIQVNLGDHLSLTTDVKFLRIIFTNLIQNSIKYSPPRSIIKIETSDEAHAIKLIFSNQVESSMIPDPSQVFNRFYRHPSAHIHRGAGLGLFLTKEMCKLLGGHITYSETQGVVSFLVEIPKS